MSQRTSGHQHGHSPTSPPHVASNVSVTNPHHTQPAAHQPAANHSTASSVANNLRALFQPHVHQHHHAPDYPSSAHPSNRHGH